MTLVSNAAYHAITAEERLLEAAMLLQALEDHDSFNVAIPKNSKVNVTIDTDTQTATISALLPLNYRVMSDGSLTIRAREYLATPGDVPITAQP